MYVEHLNIHKPWQEQALGGVRPGKTACVVRYGGFGDMLQMSSILPGLKAQGYSITVNTDHRGFEIIKHDPLVDAVFMQKQNQVPNQELSDYWDELASKFDKFIQLSESIEGTLLALPGRDNYKFSHKRLHSATNRNYLAWTHHLAKVPLPPKPKFHPTKFEIEKAEQYIKDLGCNKFIVWALSGSSVHKAYPYTDNVLARIFLNSKDIKVVFVGDTLCQLLEEPWRHESRVVRECGRMGIRDVLTLAQRADLVIGPETGVLNCVAYEEVPKIMMLSHSSPVNLGNTWVNADILTPKGVACYPCHKIHYGWATCNRDEYTGGAKCAAGISPYKVFNSIKRKLAS